MSTDEELVKARVRFDKEKITVGLLYELVKPLSGALDRIATAIGNESAAEDRREAERVSQYEKRTMILERLAMALEHYNEQKFHTT
jgi:hypothetical protein